MKKLYKAITQKVRDTLCDPDQRSHLIMNVTILLLCITVYRLQNRVAELTIRNNRIVEEINAINRILQTLIFGGQQIWTI